MSNQDDKWLYDLAETANPYIEDGGFTDSVMQRIPAKRKRYRWVLPLFIAIGSVLTLWFLPKQIQPTHLVSLALVIAIAIPTIFTFLHEEYDL